MREPAIVPIVTYPPSPNQGPPPGGDPNNPYAAYSLPQENEGGYPEQYPLIDPGYSAPIPQAEYPVSGPGPVPQYPVSGPGQPVPGPQYPPAAQYPVSGPGYPISGPGQPVSGPQYPVSGPGYPVSGPGYPDPTQVGWQQQPQQPWQPAPPPSGQGKQPPWLFAVIGVLVALCLIGGTILIMKLNTGGGGTGTTQQSQGPGPSGKSSGSTSTKKGSLAGGGKYTSYKDLCTLPDMTALGDWNNPASLSDSSSQRSDSDSSSVTCEYYRYMTTSGHELIMLDIEAEVCTTVEYCQTWFKYNKDGDKGTADPNLSNVGDENSTAGNISTTGNSKTTRVNSQIRSGNLLLSCEFVVMSTSEVPVDQVQPKAAALLKQTMQVLPRDN
jgi:hypothetical protein